MKKSIGLLLMFGLMAFTFSCSAATESNYKHCYDQDVGISINMDKNDAITFAILPSDTLVVLYDEGLQIDPAIPGSNCESYKAPERGIYIPNLEHTGNNYIKNTQYLLINKEVVYSYRC